MNDAVTAGIVQAFARGLLTSTSLLANAPAAARAIAAWKQLDRERASGRLASLAARGRLDDDGSPFDLGVHLNLSQGRPLTGARYPTELLDDRGRFPGIGRLFWAWRRGAERHREAVSNELAAQVCFLVEHGLQPTHLNGHQYVELLPGMADLILRLCDQFAISVVRVALEQRLVRTTLLSGLGQPGNFGMALVKRHFATEFRDRMRRAKRPHPDAFFGTAHAGRVDLPRLRSFLSGGVAARVVEVGLHPGAPPSDMTVVEADSGWRDPLAALRPNELELLTSGALVAELEQHGWRLGRLAELGN
jgi:predicted glycoside hydrolase/deacetylase ChbG (UPF0249 family)